MKKILSTLAVLAVFIVPAAAAQTENPVVVELFTSQGCPACPAAQEYLVELARRSDVIALEYHIDYYDYGGWKDPFGSADFTRRWRIYARLLGARYEYTPFMVVAGAEHEIGSERDKVERRIKGLRESGKAAPRLSLEISGNRATITVEGAGPTGIYDLVVATYDKRRSTKVMAGENRGQTQISAHVVRSFQRVAQWTGEPVKLTVSLDGMAGDGGCAVLLQRAGGGPIIAAVEVELGG